MRGARSNGAGTESRQIQKDADRALTPEDETERHLREQHTRFVWMNEQQVVYAGKVGPGSARQLR